MLFSLWWIVRSSPPDALVSEAAEASLEATFLSDSIAWVSIAFWAAGSVGLFILKRWGRTVFSISLVLESIATFLTPDAPVSTAWIDGLSDLISLADGAIAMLIWNQTSIFEEARRTTE